MRPNRSLLRTFIVSGIFHLSNQYCYTMKILGTRSWDTPNYGLDFKMHTNNNSMSSMTYVRQEVPIPLWHLVLLQHPSKKRTNSDRPELPRVLYNSTTKTCEFWKYIRHVTAWNNVAKIMLTKGGSNMSLACPLKVGNYAMNVIQVPPDTALLKFMYHPNTLYSLEGTVFSLNPHDGVTRKRLCHYEVNATIFKAC